MPPATLLEVLRTPDRQLRQAVTKLVCRKAWRHLRTEAQAEAAELVAEIRQLRPAWILDQPDLDAIIGHERFWLRTIYDLALADAPQLLSLNHVVGTRERREISNLQEAQQVRFRSDGFFRSIEEAQEQFPTLAVTPGPPGSRTSEKRQGCRLGSRYRGSAMASRSSLSSMGGASSGSSADAYYWAGCYLC